MVLKKLCTNISEKALHEYVDHHYKNVLPATDIFLETNQLQYITDNFLLIITKLKEIQFVKSCA